ncbi:MAG: hypothetical protein B7X40_10270 [Cellulomonas sp. 14-74-6]|jgi:hypothetical protein|nr:MAG: hypothetical protein B7X40_10270 [Cellulomonas sp. 14-74-6]
MSAFTEPAPTDELLSGFGTHDTAPTSQQHRRAGITLVVASALVVAGGGIGWWLLAPGSSSGPAAHVAAFDSPQQGGDKLDADDADQLQVDPASTRLVVRTPAAATYVGRSVSGRLCIMQLPTGDVSTETCGPDRKGVVLTVGTARGGQVRLVADGGPTPAATEGWKSAGANVWTHD